MTYPKIKFKDIFDSRYRVFFDGRAFSLISNKFLKTKITRYGYESVGLYTNPGKYKWYFIHRLVAKAFLGDIPNDLQVNHIDGNKLNNHISNLEYVTQSENAKHSYRLGLQDKKGEKHHKAKLKEQDIKDIRSYRDQQVKIKHIAQFMSVSYQCIYDILIGRRWAHVK